MKPWLPDFHVKLLYYPGVLPRGVSWLLERSLEGITRAGSGSVFTWFGKGGLIASYYSKLLPTFVYSVSLTHFPRSVVSSLYFRSLAWQQCLSWPLSAAKIIILIGWTSRFDILEKVCKRRKTRERRQEEQGTSVDWLIQSRDREVRENRIPSGGSVNDFSTRPYVVTPYYARQA